jgi:hypothetical protein
MIYSLLLTSFILVFAFSSSFAQSVSFENKNALRCEDGVMNITVDPGADVSAIEVVFEVSSADGAFFDALNVVWDGGFGVLTNRVVDLSGVDGVSPDTVRIAAMSIDDGDGCLASGATVVAQVQYTTNNVCTGTVDLAGADKVCENVTGTTQFVDCATTALVGATVTAGTVTINNVAPTVDPIADATLHWGESYVGSIVADDGDLANGCEALSYSKVSGPANLTVNANTGSIVWTTTGADVCEHVVEVQVEDACGATAVTSFSLCVQNDAPAFTDATGDEIIWGNVAAGTSSADDPDGGPAALLYSALSFNGPGAVTVDPATGDWSWPTLEDNSYIGTFELCLLVTDGAPVCDPCSPANADTICVEIRVIPTMRVTIEKVHNAYQGHYQWVSINLDNSIEPGLEMGGFDFLLHYDASALSFVGAEPGALIDTAGCGWEYFVYRFGPNGNCGPSACPSGMLRIVAIAETNNGANHPDCFGGGTGYASELARLNFLVSDDRTLECQYAAIRWRWYDCGDNAISSVTGDTLYISRHVYDYDNPTPIENLTAAFPTFLGANEDCDFELDPNKPEAIRLIDFQNGGIDIVCADSIDARGDINLNDIDNEIADAVLFSNYFVQGLSAFNINLEGQIAATDVNADGLTLSVADLVYLIRIIVGDALPYSKVVPTEVAADYVHTSNGTLSVVDDVRMGAAFVQVAGNQTPELLAADMEMRYAFDGVNTRILVWSIYGNSFAGDFLRVNGDLVSVEMATEEGNPVVGKLLPTEYALFQNYPNPFNPSTVLSFALPTASDYTLTVYNINGQQVASFTGHAEASVVELEWEAGDLASGVYLYHLQAGSFSATSKMVLLK